MCKYGSVGSDPTYSSVGIETTLLNHSKGALTAYNYLCERCDRGTLNLHLGMLQDSSFRVLDTWETAAPGIRRRDLKGIFRRAKDLLRDIERLRDTPLIWALVSNGTIRRDDLLFSLCPLDQRFHTL